MDEVHFDEIVTYDEERLRKALERLPCHASNEDGTEQGVPINLVLIGSGDEVHSALIASGWAETEALSGKAATARDKPSVLKSKYAPVSPLYVYGRPQDAAFTNHKNTEECIALKFEIGPTDSPPCGRVPSFEIRSTKQSEKLRNS
jgi:hypothetical protein